MWRDYWQRSVFGNPVSAYVLAAGLLSAVGLATVWIFRHLIVPRAERWTRNTKTPIDDFLVAALREALTPLLYYGSLYFAFRSLTLNIAIAKAVSSFGLLLLTFVAVRFLLQGLQFGIFQVWLPGRPDAVNLERQMKAVMPVLSLLIWGLGAVFLLDNLGFKITTLVAGLGIGGVALALASQTILGDMFSYFAIMLDRPFELDDFIIIGDFMGTVEHIGIKTTRLRSLGGEQLVFSNKDLTDSRVRNYKRMQLRRIVFKLGVTYDTSVDKLKRAVALVKSIIVAVPDTRFDRAHFASYGDFNLVIEVVYYVLSADYNKYMDTQQEINLAIKEAFEKERIEFAFPTQTILMP